MLRFLNLTNRHGAFWLKGGQNKIRHPPFLAFCAASGVISRNAPHSSYVRARAFKKVGKWGNVFKRQEDPIRC